MSMSYYYDFIKYSFCVKTKIYLRKKTDFIFLAIKYYIIYYGWL